MPDEIKARQALKQNPFPDTPFVEVTEDFILIKCGFSEQLLQLLRWVPKVEWRPDKRYWRVPIASAEAVRGVLPEVLRLSELTQPSLARQTGSGQDLPQTEVFKGAARLIFGGDWQRDTANALGRDETELVRWLLGEHALQDAGKLMEDMLKLMRQRAEAILKAADDFEKTLVSKKIAAHD